METKTVHPLPAPADAARRSFDPRALGADDVPDLPEVVVGVAGAYAPVRQTASLPEVA